VPELESRSFSAFVAALIDVLESHEVPYAVAGSVASGLYGEPRTTLDVNLTLQLEVVKVAPLASAARAVDLTLDDVAVRERLTQSRPQPFNIIDHVGGWRADCYLLRDEFDRAAFARRRQVEFRSTATGSLWVLSAEDVILYKLVYYRMSDGVSVKHLRDIAGMLATMRADSAVLDIAYLERWAHRHDVLRIWKEIAGRHAADS
jgi:hypothetical protein